MFSTLRQRIIIALAGALAALALLWVRPWLEPSHGFGGVSISHASAGLLLASLIALAGLIPALVLGLLASLRGHPLTTLFVPALALIVLTAQAGSIDDWMRQSNLPSVYQGWLLETLGWLAFFLLAGFILQGLRGTLRGRQPAVPDAELDYAGENTRWWLPDLQTLASAGVATLVGGGLSWVLLRSGKPGQIIVGLIIAFLLGGLAAQSLFPKMTNPLGVCLSPFLAALAAYGYMLFTYQRHEQILAAWYRGAMPGLAQASPLHFASAGLAGAILGITWSQGLIADHRSHHQTPAPSPQQ